MLCICVDLQRLHGIVIEFDIFSSELDIDLLPVQQIDTDSAGNISNLITRQTQRLAIEVGIDHWRRRRAMELTLCEEPTLGAGIQFGQTGGVNVPVQRQCRADAAISADP